MSRGASCRILQPIRDRTNGVRLQGIRRGPPAAPCHPAGPLCDGRSKPPYGTTPSISPWGTHEGRVVSAPGVFGICRWRGAGEEKGSEKSEDTVEEFHRHHIYCICAGPPRLVGAQDRPGSPYCRRAVMATTRPVILKGPGTAASRRLYKSTLSQ